jgi:Na+/H+-dicarboxylate symporter
MDQNNASKLTTQIVIAMLLGITIGSLIHLFPDSPFKTTLTHYLVNGLFDTGGSLFITLLKFSVVPIVLISLTCGMIYNVGNQLKLGRIASQTVIFYLVTTSVAITLALILAHIFDVGGGELALNTPVTKITEHAPSLKETFLNAFPSNPFKALADGNMLQVIFLSLILGSAISRSKEKGKTVATLFLSLNEVVINLVTIILKIAPLGVFCLLATVFSSQGASLIPKILGYFLTVILALLVQLFLIYSVFLKFFAKLSPLYFYKSMLQAMLFAFSTSSSSASIPVVLHTTEKKLGVHNTIASFVIPLGATINMDGTAIMQGVATVFIANSYHIHLGVIGCLKVILMATLASIGTAGIPGVGLITLSMVLMQVNIPVEGIGLIIGIDRFLDMCRTAVNVAGDATIACCVANREKVLKRI